ncbi:hypothetical protein LY78DRAFT_732542 [Colletotrichum sublineola]|nr:hypothetical protein LY78DRAFT_732542 [Colletotrichum sublineola]
MWSVTSRSWVASLSSLVLLFTLLLGVAAQDLGISLDKRAQDETQRIIYSTKLTFGDDTSRLFNDQQLYGLAALAYSEMQTKFHADGIAPHQQPSMIAAMAVGHDIYISSSLKNGTFLYDYADSRSKSPVLNALNRCQAGLQQFKKVPVNDQHRTRGSCAEVFALHEWSLDPDVPQQARAHRPATRVVAYGKPGGRGPDSVGPQNPCGGGEIVNDKGLLTWGSYVSYAEFFVCYVLLTYVSHF